LAGEAAVATRTYDVVIVGGGVMGSAVAYFLRAEGFAGRVLVLERDLTYRHASSGLSVGGIRQQYGTAINIQLSRASLSFYERFPEQMEVRGDRPDIAFRQRGYLFLGDAARWPIMQRWHRVQREHGVEAVLLAPEEARALVPDLSLDGIHGASFGWRDGTLDPGSVLQGFVRKARDLGAEYLEDEVIGIGIAHGRVTGVATRRSGVIASPIVVNAAGPRAGALARLAGLTLPVEPVRRQVYVFEPERALPYDLPLVIDVTGIYFRQEPGGRVLTGRSFPDDPHTFDFTWDRDRFFTGIWPDLARRMPCFHQLRLERGWAGLYDMNVVDQNAILGAHPEVAGLFCIAGFSGHGFQQAPAAGRGVAELIRAGRFLTLDLSPLTPARFTRGALLLEEAVI
jgi:glycine/D-amino acid oxidase-like deaminating enzyme